MIGWKAVLLAVSGLMLPRVFAGPIVLQIEPEEKPGSYVVTLKNQGPDSLAVVGRKTRADSFVSMTFSLQGGFLPATRTREDIAPYLVLQVRLVSVDKVLLVHPPELAGSGTLEAAYEDARFFFSPGQEYLFKMTLPESPVLAEVHLVNAVERRNMIHALWRAAAKRQGVAGERK